MFLMFLFGRVHMLTSSSLTVDNIRIVVVFASGWPFFVFFVCFLYSIKTFLESGLYLTRLVPVLDLGRN